MKEIKHQQKVGVLFLTGQGAVIELKRNNFSNGR
jgi:hypothetical protein